MDWGADPGAIEAVAVREFDPLVDAIDASVAGLQASDPAELDGSTLGERILRLEALLAQLSAHQLRCIQTLDARGDPEVVGAGSTRAWLRKWARLGPGAASARVTLARRLADRHAVMSELEQGTISVRHAEVVTRAIAEVRPHLASEEQAAELESNLLQVARYADPLRLADVCARLRHQVAPLASVDTEYANFHARYLSVSRTLDGMIAIDGLLDPATGETVMAALHACSAPRGSRDDRTSRQRRADALSDVCRHALVSGGLPATGGERPQVLVTVDINTLRGDTSAEPAEFGWAGPISGELARRIACDASITRVITDGPSQPLDVGRSTRVIPTAIRRALWIRDRGCRYPDCKAPPQWCDAHHQHHWAAGGATSLDNLVLLCGYHHTRLHLRGEALVIDADGSVRIANDRHIRELRGGAHRQEGARRWVA